MTVKAGTVTILFTDLVNSTTLLERAGDESAQRVFAAHHKLLRDAVAANAGQEVKWLGDGLMVAFPSAADAVRCAIAMQQGSRRPTAGERLEVRVGLNVGDALRDERDYFGTPVVIARRLCDQADGGRIVCSALVAGLLSGRQAFAFRELGDLELKGVSNPVAACEVLYEGEQPRAFLTQTPFVGRAGELTTLEGKLGEARAGHGGLVMLVGEPGIGKTRLAEEFSDVARTSGSHVLWGRCYEGEWAPAYGPFAELIEEHARLADPGELAEDLGRGAAPIARLLPALREKLPEIPEPVPLQPAEERFRLLEAVSLFLVAISRRSPVVVVLDDLHWADAGTLAMLRHAARIAPKHRMLIVGLYRDVELDRQHPLASALGALRRETAYERLVLRGLDEHEVGVLLETIAEQEVNQALVQAISEETEGNPFFIREVLAHLVEEGKLYREGGTWKSSARSIAELGIPEGVRDVVTRRLSRLSQDANRLLTAASAFSGGFRFDVAASVAGLDDRAALDAVDEAFAAQLLRPSGDADTYDFTHALIRHTLYGELSPSRQVRLHRQIAEALERAYGERAFEHAAELAYQYHRSAAVAGAERGIDFACAAADRAEAAYAHAEAASFLRMALELMPADDRRRPRLAARLGTALTWALAFDEALSVLQEAGDAIAAAEGTTAGADFLDEAAATSSRAGSPRAWWALAEQGLRYIGDRRDPAWARLLLAAQEGKDAFDPESVGVTVPLASPQYDEWRRVVESLPPPERFFPLFMRTRAEALAWLDRLPEQEAAVALTFIVGDWRRALPLWEASAATCDQQGQLAGMVFATAMQARCQNVLGDFVAARATYERGVALAARVPQESANTQQIVAALDEMRYAAAEEIDLGEALVRFLLMQDQPELRWARAAVYAAGARIYAIAGRTDEAIDLVARTVPAVERAPGWEGNYPRTACDGATALWLSGRTDFVDVFERGVREKVVVPDFRYPMQDARTALGRLCALQHRWDEAAQWFAEARRVTDEQGARPLRAIVDHDEGLMYVRRGAPGDRGRAVPLLNAAIAQMSEIGMTGWVARATRVLADASS